MADMAVSAVLRRGATSHALTIADAFDPPKIPATATVVGVIGSAAPRIAQERVEAVARMDLPLLLLEASHAALQAEVQAIDAFLRLGECTLEVTFTDATEATIWTVYHAQPVQPYFSRSADLAHWGTATLNLLVSSFVTLATVTLYDAESITAPASLDLSAMVGNYRAPLSIECEATGDDTHALYLAIDATSHDDYISDCVDLTWDAGETDTADADARTGNAAYIASETPVTAAKDTAGLPEGPYLILARVKVLGGETGYITSDFTDDLIEFTQATWHTVELGTCYLPTKKVRRSASADLVISVYGSSDTAGDEVCVDWIYPLPMGDGLYVWHPSDAATDATVIAREADDATTYIDDVADEQHVTGTTLMALGGTLIIVAENASGDDPEQAADVTVTYQPRFGWMR